jgi:pimeloyl-[acyl-carrier protein] methyl ester esterase
VKLLFVHGWGFDNSIWAGLAGRFPDSDMWDRGYFGEDSEPVITGSFVAVTHSFGTMRLLASLPSACRGIVAINGFDRFCEDEGFPGVQRRVLDRMIARFASDPGEVLRDFRRRCGSIAPVGPFGPARLREDLLALREGDCRDQLARSGIPVLSLQGGQDPIVPVAMREAVFAAAGSCERVTIESGGHLLPTQETAPCAKAISAFKEQLT